MPPKETGHNNPRASSRLCGPLAAFTLALVVLMDFCSLSALHGCLDTTMHDRRPFSSTSSTATIAPPQNDGTSRIPPGVAVPDRSFVRSGHNRTSADSNVRRQNDPDSRSPPEGSYDSNKIPAPLPSARIPSPATMVDPATAPTGTPPPGTSPYEEKHPGEGLPEWAKKRYVVNITNADVPPSRTVCYVHVGKTAGSTIGCALGFRLHCQGHMWHPPDSVLFRSTTNVHHSNVNDCTLHHDYYLVTLRDPIERLLSWYEYEERLLDRLRVDCGFTTLNSLAVMGLSTTKREDVSDACRNRARRAIVGEEQFGFHAYHNYGYHLKQVPSNASVTVIRAEHLVQDWNSMERLFGSDARVESFPRLNPANNETKEARFLSGLGRVHLCRTLCDEIQVYKSILYRAVNLDPSDVETSLSELRRSCPKEADLPACPR